MACCLKRPCREVRKGYREHSRTWGMCLYHDLFGIAEDLIGPSNQLEQVHEILWGIYLRDVQGEGPGW